MPALDVELDLYEAYQILEKALQEQFPGCSIEQVAITSYGKPKLTFGRDGLCEGVEFRHRLVIPRQG
jgi:hypothetical protein